MMDHPVQAAFSFFSRRYERILLIVLFVQLPLLVAYFYIANTLYAVTPSFGSAFTAADVFNAYFMLLFFIFAQIPFIYFWHYEELGEEKPLLKAFLKSAIHAFHFSVFGAVLSAIVIVGFAFFIHPGLLLLAMYISALLLR